MNDAPRWEYKSVTLGGFVSKPKDEAIEATLNALGMQGWEAVNAYSHPNSSEVRVLLKRPLSEEAARRQRRSLA
jgi:hypothetical protein